jgi:hypothetical protein
MRRKKVFIAIVILLVLGLGVLTEYQRRTRDIEFEVPSWTQNSSDNFMAVSNRWVVCETLWDGLIAYSIPDQTRIKVAEFGFDTSVAMDEPWVVLADYNSVTAFDLRDSRHYQLSENLYITGVPAIDGNVAIWVEEGNVVGYNLDTKSKFPIASGDNIMEDQDQSGNKFVIMASGERQNPDICGDIVVWTEVGFESSRMIVGYNLRSKEKFIVRESTCEILSLRISNHYIVWKEKESDAPDKHLYALMTYDLNDKTLTRVSSGIDSFFDIDIDGDIVVWDHWRDGSGSDIFGHNLSTGKTFQICTALYLRGGPKISDHTVIWYDNRSEGWLSKILRKEPRQIRGKIFRHWPGEGGK